MVRNPSEEEKLIRSKAADIGIFTLDELSKRTGINRVTLNKRFRYPRTLTFFEYDALDSVLKFTDEEALFILRGNRKWDSMGPKKTRNRRTVVRQL